MNNRKQHRMVLVARRLILGLALALVFANVPTQLKAQSYTVLYSFTGGTDGGYPIAGLIKDEQGNLYSTTWMGGAFGNGTVFKLDRRGNETVLYSFQGGTDGEQPTADLVRDQAGNLYGTTRIGGAAYGTVFKLDPQGVETVLYTFTGFADGGNPQAGLVMDKAGNLYGTTLSGGTTGFGTVFTVDPSGREKVLHSFSATGGDGAYPYAALIHDEAGNLYGTTYGGGVYGYGTVFKVDANGLTTILYSFTGAGDGSGPVGGLIRDRRASLYGTTYSGGAYGFGTVFELTASGTESVLYSFTGGNDGATPSAGLVRDAAGNLYGTTEFGGASPCQGLGCGVVFSVSKDGKETVLHDFTGGTDGSNPESGLIRKGNSLYGTTPDGGAYSVGTLFKLRTSDDD